MKKRPPALGLLPSVEGNLRIASFNVSEPGRESLVGERGRIITRIRKLSFQMRAAVQVENYEEAAKIRDEIKSLANLI